MILTTFALAERPFTKLPPEVVDRFVELFPQPSKKISSLLVASSIKTYAVDLGKKGKFREAQFYREGFKILFWSGAERKTIFVIIGAERWNE